MGYPKHFLVAFGGTMGSAESWSCSIRMTSSTMSVAPDAVLNEYAANNVQVVHDKVLEYLNALGGKWHESARLGFVKFNGINEAGHYTSNTTSEVQHSTPIVVGQSSSRGPFQLSMAISLGTANTRGLASRGRFFLPAPPFVVDIDGYLAQDTCLAYANATALFIDSLNDWPNTDIPGAPDVSVVSRGKKLGSNQWGEGTFARVTQVRVGNVMDTQQSRRRSLDEKYFFANTAVEGA